MRITLLGYSIIAIFGFRETRQLIGEDYRLQDDTLFVPLVLCVPASIEVDGTTVAYDASDGEKCRQLDYLINAAAASLLFSILASILFLLVDLMARYKRGPFNMSSAAGMGLFLVFILLQAGISTGALVEQVNFWVQYFQHVVDVSDGQFGYDKVESYAKKSILITTAIWAFFCSFFIFVDAIVHRCCQAPANVKTEDTEQTIAEQAMQRQSIEIAEASQGFSKPLEISSSEPDAPSWASSGVL
jgi:hypothetical protein